MGILELVIYCADIGSIKNERFGWCRYELKCNSGYETGTSIRVFTDSIVRDLDSTKKVALGFECPLFIPMQENEIEIGSKRIGEGNRSWSAGAGCSVLVTGIAEYLWIFNRIANQKNRKVIPTFDWDQFIHGNENLFIWEAFITGSEKGKEHYEDAEIAVQSFIKHYPNINDANCIEVSEAFNLVGAALLRSGIVDDINKLTEKAIVLKGV